MKIISKFKDYYDHQVAAQGYDETRVYDRRNNPPWHTIDPYMDGSFLIAIAGIYHPVVRRGNKFYHTREEAKQDNIPFDRSDVLVYQGDKTDINAIHRQPVLCVSDRHTWKVDERHMVFGIPRLEDFGFPARIPPEEMYRIIYDFLGWLKDNPPPPDKQTDKEKVVAHGFDLKKSFRPKMK